MKSEPFGWWQRQTSACAGWALNRATVKPRRMEDPIRDMGDSALYTLARVKRLVRRREYRRCWDTCGDGQEQRQNDGRSYHILSYKTTITMDNFVITVSY